MKRIVLFLATNLAIVLVLSLTMRILGVEPYLTANGLNLTSLLIFAAVMGFGGSLISLAISKWVAKKSMGVRVIETPSNSTEFWLVETVKKLAFEDRARWYADPQFAKVPVEWLISKEYATERRALIREDAAAQAYQHGSPRPGADTIYLTVADGERNMVSLIQSNYRGMASALTRYGLGLVLLVRGVMFSLDPRHPNCYAPPRRPFHTIIPAFPMKDGQPQMSFGVMGGNMQPQGHLQTLVRMLDFRQEPQAACDAPRWRFNQGLSINVEATMPAATREGLRELGHQVESFQDSYQDFGAGQFIWRLGDPAVEGYVAASDPRRDGLAAAS